MVTTNQNPTTDIQKLASKEHKHATKEKNHQGRNKKKRMGKNYENNQKTSNKMAISIKVILIIDLLGADLQRDNSPSQIRTDRK